MWHMCSSHIIIKSKLFLVQIQLEMSDLQNPCGSSGSRYVKRISWVQRWILNNKIVTTWCRLHSWCLPLSENFDGWSLLGAELFAFEICLENCTNFEGTKFSFHSLSDDFDFSMALSFVYMNQGGFFWRVILEGHFLGLFFCHIWGHFWG